MSDLQRLIGEQLKLIRKMKNLTQEQVAERTGKEGMNKSRISDIERGRINISLRTLEMLMNALSISPTELFDLKHLSGAEDIQEKHMIIDIHRYTLMDRELDEVKHVVDSTKSLFGIIDSRSAKRQ